MQTSPIETGDFSHCPVDHGIASLERSARTLEVVWSDGHVSEFLYLWLRDNCPCGVCVHAQTKERLFDLLSVPEDLRPASVRVSADGALAVVWANDGHQSRYHPGWLRHHCYSESARTARRRRVRTWDAGLAGNLPEYPFRGLMTDDGILLDGLRALREVGVAMVLGAPPVPGTVGSLTERVSRIRTTNFGTLFDVCAVAQPNSTAYTALELPLHTDLPTRELQPGYQLLHCLVNQAQGGESVLVDGFHIAEVLRREDPETFAVLTTVPLEFRFHDEDSDYRSWGPVIRLDHAGGFDEIRFNTFICGPFDVPARRMAEVYRAFRRYFAMTRELRYQVRFRLTPGDLMVFDNRRVLHARTAFDTASGPRRLQGCYMDRDEVLSRIRVLERRPAPPAAPVPPAAAVPG